SIRLLASFISLLKNVSILNRISNTLFFNITVKDCFELGKVEIKKARYKLNIWLFKWCPDVVDYRTAILKMAF
ncbi:hypothetical protein, partial [Halobacteriovorax sp.]|uniref:hypothetical protein n=1 Tax=Halobacteriovorax sp. TaxID=2020862 RepID=UPI0035653AA6